MESVIKQRIHKTEALAWALFIVFIIFASALPGIEISGIGLLYPFRLCLPFVCAYCILFKKLNTVLFQQNYWKLFGVFALMLVCGVLTLFWTPNISETIKQLANYLFGFALVACIVILVNQPNKLYRVAFICMIVMLFVMVLGIYEGITGNYIFADEWENIYPYNNNITIHYTVVCFGNPNDLIFTAIGFMPFINVALKNIFVGNKRKFRYILACSYYLLTLANAVLSSCRMGILLLFGILYLGLFFNKNEVVRRFAQISLCCVFVVGIIGFRQIVDIISRESRVVIWLNVLRNAKNYFYLGMGPGTSYLELPGVEYVGMVINPHFWFLEIFAEFGVVVFLVVFCGYIYIGYKSWRIYNKSTGEAKDLSSSTLKFIIYFIPMNIMSSSISAMPSFWLMISFAAIAVVMAGHLPKDCITERGNKRG